MYQELHETDSCVVGTLLGIGANMGQTREPPEKYGKSMNKVGPESPPTEMSGVVGLISQTRTKDEKI
jgi:hypothetical protein